MTLLLLFNSGPSGYVPTTSTAILQNPVNCVLAGQQPYESWYKTADVPRQNIKYKSIMRRGSLRDLFKGDK